MCVCDALCGINPRVERTHKSDHFEQTLRCQISRGKCIIFRRSENDRIPGFDSEVPFSSRTVKAKCRTVMASVEKLGKLTPNLKGALRACRTLSEIEHLVSSEIEHLVHLVSSESNTS